MADTIKHPAGLQYNVYFELEEADGLQLSTHLIGHLPVHSGGIVVADPFGAIIQQPFSEAVPVGQHPLEACVAVAPEMPARIALLRWKWGESPAVAWHLAVASDVPLEDLQALQPNEFVGVEFPYGLAFLGDVHSYEQHLIALQTHIVEQTSDYASEVLAPALAASPMGLWASLYEGNAQACVATTGWGEGLFPAYWGTDAAGKVVELVVDFFLVGSYEEL